VSAHALPDVGHVLDRLQTDGYAVIADLLEPATVTDLRERVERRLVHERAHPFDPPDPGPTPDPRLREHFDKIWHLGEDESARLERRIAHRRLEEFDTPWPVGTEDVCISFLHIPTLFDDGRSQRIFNLINKDLAFAPLIEHPLVLSLMEHELGRDAIALDVSVNHVGPHTDSGGWHVDSPITQIPEPLPSFTLSIQSVWMLDEFSADNGATHVVRGSHLSLRKPPGGRDALDGEVVLESPAGSLAIWLSQTWHRHGANVTDQARCGVIVQYGRSWVKPFVDLRSPLTAEQAAQLSPRMRYLLGCNANAPVRG
jgi:ectoine hydroxylase-related dioxygenase (phytanoyl-CoA dioxygenase family)